ncbi:MAG: hypothetical protein CM1200mP14_12700 [Gammaproteobacteria bacterium]|nr:MAG: hypothetical protein CM1200mP14_12700 [Gammaproteobacteria bacterium]
MSNKFKLLPFLVLVAGLLTQTQPISAQAQDDSTRIAELETQIEAITRDLEELTLGTAVVNPSERGAFGMAPAAGKVYTINQGVSIGGYGEVLYQGYAGAKENGDASGKTAKLDAYRGIIYVGYKFNDKVLFNSEIEIEHGSTGLAGSASLEFAYLDYKLTDNFGLRAGLLLVPVGITNEVHEPPVWLGTIRPRSENKIIPTTWRESGFGFFGETETFSYRAYLVNSLDGIGGGSAGSKGFSSSGLRGGRQKGSKAIAENFSAVGRVDYTGTPGLMIGTSLYTGDQGHNSDLNGREVSIGTTIWEGHIKYQGRGFDIQALTALASVDNADKLNEMKGLTGSGSVGEKMSGWYAQLGYDLLFSSASEQALLPYVRYEAVNTQVDVPSGYSSSGSKDFNVTTIGLAWKPIGNTVLKTDYEIHSNASSSGINQFNVAIGWLF